METCSLYAYRFPIASFLPQLEVGGFWVSEESVEALEQVKIGDLFGAPRRSRNRDSNKFSVNPSLLGASREVDRRVQRSSTSERLTIEALAGSLPCPLMAGLMTDFCLGLGKLVDLPVRRPCGAGTHYGSTAEDR